VWFYKMCKKCKLCYIVTKLNFRNIVVENTEIT